MTARASSRALDEEAVLKDIEREARIDSRSATTYLRLLRAGALPASSKDGAAKVLIERGMAIVSGDGKRVVPVHPRLGIANQYRTWREMMVKEINDRRMRVDRLILELIPVYEAATEKRMEARGK